MTPLERYRSHRAALDAGKPEESPYPGFHYAGTSSWLNTDQAAIADEMLALTDPNITDADAVARLRALRGGGG